jgi:large conductance mechanosensitive channel
MASEATFTVWDGCFGWGRRKAHTASPRATRQRGLWMKAIQEFKEFAVKGNVVDMAVGVVIGAGFGKIVSSLVADIITPVLGILIGGVNFTNLKVTLKDAVADKPPVTWNYGSFIQSIFDFLIIAWAIFVLVKLINRLKRQAPKPPPAPAAPPAPSAEVQLLTEIRDALKGRSTTT